MATDLDTTIEELAAKPRSVASEDGSITNVAIQDVIAADKYLARKTARSSATMGIRLGKFKQPEHLGW